MWRRIPCCSHWMMGTTKGEGSQQFFSQVRFKVGSSEQKGMEVNTRIICFVA